MKHGFAGALLGGTILTASLFASASAAELPKTVQNGVIAFAITDAHWGGNFSADVKAECPNGINEGPREQYKIMFPDPVPGAPRRKLVDTQLKMEMAQFFPMEWKDPTPYKEALGKTAIGLNLDGKVGPNDFTSPDGTTGVDNQFYRALGCVGSYRGPNGNNFVFGNKWIRDKEYNRSIYELSGVDDLQNDADVTVTVFRGTERMRVDAAGNDIMPGGSQPVNTRWGDKTFRTVLKGKIVNGVLMTEAHDVTMPWWQYGGGPGQYLIRGMRMQVKLTPTGGEGLIAGYVDVNSWNDSIVMSWHNLINAYGQFQTASVYQSMMRLADGYPDPKTGANTAISTAIDARFAQVFVVHAPPAQANAGASTQRLAQSTGIKTVNGTAEQR